MMQMRDHSNRRRRCMRVALGSILVFVLAGCSGMTGDTPKVVVPQGTHFAVSLNESLGTATNQPGETFFATTTRDLTINDTVALPAGSRVRGVLSKVEEPGRTKGRAKMTLVFNGVMTKDEEWHDIAALPIALEAPAQTESDIEKVAGGGVAGAVIGAIAGGKKGAAIGGIIGASAGGVVVLATKGDQITLPSGQQFSVELKSSVTLPAAPAA